MTRTTQHETLKDDDLELGTAVMTYTVEATLNSYTEGSTTLYEYVVKEYTNLIHFDIWEQYTISIRTEKVHDDNIPIYFENLHFNGNTKFKVNVCDNKGDPKYVYDSTEIDIYVTKGLCLNGTYNTGSDTYNATSIKSDTWKSCTLRKYTKRDGATVNLFIAQQSMFVPFCECTFKNSKDNVLTGGQELLLPHETMNPTSYYMFGDDILEYVKNASDSKISSDTRMVQFSAEFIYNNVKPFRVPKTKSFDTKGALIDTENQNIRTYNVRSDHNTYLMTYTPGDKNAKPYENTGINFENCAGFNISDDGMLYMDYGSVSYGLFTYLNNGKVVIRGFQFNNNKDVFNLPYDINWCTKGGAVTLISTNEVIPQFVTEPRLKKDESDTTEPYCNTADAEIEYHFETPMLYPRAEMYNPGVDTPKTYTMRFKYHNAYQLADIVPRSKQSWVHYDNGITIERGAVLESEVPVYIHLTSQSGDSAVVNIAGTLKAPICIIR